ncbi:hypothetical protein [Kitasatospora cineracea]|uniref:hypothetical protein n=1 Tax=Kitasatospora cineracea TaxID=88074 RepID=UPI00378D8EEA
MSDGYIRWYRERTETRGFIAQVKYFGAHGVLAIHPGRQVFVMLDVDGNDVPMGLDEADRLLSFRLGPVNMTWWLSEDVDVVCEYSYEPLGCEVQTFRLDGLTDREVGIVRDALTAAAGEFPASTRALIIDCRGVAEPEEWDSLVLYGGDSVPKLPELVLAREPVASQLLGSSPKFCGTDVGEGLTRIELRQSA